MAITISDLERKMLECDKHCANHQDTLDSVNKLEKCLGNTKNRLNKLSGKFSWIIGLLFFSGVALGYCANSISNIQTRDRQQAAINQITADHSIQIEKLVTGSSIRAVTITQTQYDIKYIKQELSEIKKLLKEKS